MINTKFGEASNIPLWLIWFQLVLTLTISIFECTIGIMTTIALRGTGLTNRWLFYAAVWLILLSYIAVGMFQSLLYFNEQYKQILAFNVAEARLLA